MNKKKEFIICPDCGTKVYYENAIAGKCISCSGKYNPSIKAPKR